MASGNVLFIPAPIEVETWGEGLASDFAAWDWLMGIEVSGNTNRDATEPGEPAVAS